MNDFYTYAYLREDKTPYYIGKGRGDRINSKNRAFTPPKSETRKIFLKQNLTEEEAFKHEIYMIAVFGRKDLGTGILRNRTDGGEGASNQGTPEQRSEIARKREVNKTPEQRSEAARKAKASMTPEQRSEASRKAHASMTPEQQSEWSKKIHASRTPEQRREAARKGHASRTPEQRSEASRKAQASMTPEQRSEAARKREANKKMIKYQKDLEKAETLPKPEENIKPIDNNDDIC